MLASILSSCSGRVSALFAECRNALESPLKTVCPLLLQFAAVLSVRIMNAESCSCLPAGPHKTPQICMKVARVVSYVLYMPYSSMLYSMRSPGVYMSVHMVYENCKCIYEMCVPKYDQTALILCGSCSLREQCMVAYTFLLLGCFRRHPPGLK